MLTGFYVLLGSGGSKFTATFPRGGLAATFQIQVLDLVGSPTTLGATIDHKNVEDTSFSIAGSFPTINSISVATLSVSAIKEQVRYAFALVASNSWEGFYILLPDPSWRPY